MMIVKLGDYLVERWQLTFGISMGFRESRLLCLVTFFVPDEGVIEGRMRLEVLGRAECDFHPLHIPYKRLQSVDGSSALSMN